MDIIQVLIERPSVDRRVISGDDRRRLVELNVNKPKRYFEALNPSITWWTMLTNNNKISWIQRSAVMSLFENTLTLR